MPSEDRRLVDTFGRVHTNLRISVTDRCNIRCFYCMEEDVEFLPREELLTYEELVRVVRVATGLGVDKVRITGGEPLVRRDLPILVERLCNLDGLRDVSLTTNGLLLEPMAEDLWEAGLRRINIHLDSLDPERFRSIARRPGVEKVVAAIHRCRELGYDPIKINAVALKGRSEPDIVELAQFAREYDLDVRFIEVMPLGAGRDWDRSNVLLAGEILERIQQEVGALEDDRSAPSSPAEVYPFSDGRGRIGIIASVSRPFCRSCNRVRLTADGKLRNCLFALDELDLRAVIRNGGSDEAVADCFRRNVRDKWEGHEINRSQFVQPDRAMHAIGG